MLEKGLLITDAKRNPGRVLTPPTPLQHAAMVTWADQESQWSFMSLSPVAETISPSARNYGRVSPFSATRSTSTP